MTLAPQSHKAMIAPRKSWSDAFTKRQAERKAEEKRKIVRLKDGRPAYTRGGFVTQAMIDAHGGYQAARQAVAERKEQAR